MAKYNRFIKFKHLNLNTGTLSISVLNMEYISSIDLNAVEYGGKNYDILYSLKKGGVYYVPVEYNLLEVLKQLGDQVYEI